MAPQEWIFSGVGTLGLSAIVSRYWYGGSPRLRSFRTGGVDIDALPKRFVWLFLIRYDGIGSPRLLTYKSRDWNGWLVACDADAPDSGIDDDRVRSTLCSRLGVDASQVRIDYAQIHAFRSVKPTRDRVKAAATGEVRLYHFTTIPVSITPISPSMRRHRFRAHDRKQYRWTSLSAMKRSRRTMARNEDVVMFVSRCYGGNSLATLPLSSD